MHINYFIENELTTDWKSNSYRINPEKQYLILAE